ncbi:MAG: precorrin-4 C(11)-methyltransferase [Eubacterium sp.]|jgi:precorrin-4/cobalt-precorrin-4 C11-methyltransferase|nr:precorrin-4 C(11)-methyltransferase [Eubacterium sp.]
MIHFVGAGSGAVDLITLRGKLFIEKADVIVYAGSLINKQLLNFAKTDAELYDSAYFCLDEIISILEQAERDGKTTVRLHSGDPSLYGAIREQMHRLDRLGIEYDVCPGVSSFCGAAAALKAELTPPEISQTVILTRIEGKTPVPEKENIRELSEHGATMAVFLSAGMLSELQVQLLSGGYTNDTPVAIVYKATWDDEKIVRGKLSELSVMGKEAGISKTALVFVGEFLDGYPTCSSLYDKNFETAFRRRAK